jgi:hypothetical protein
MKNNQVNNKVQIATGGRITAIGGGFQSWKQIGKGELDATLRFDKNYNPETATNFSAGYVGHATRKNHDEFLNKA